MTQRLEASGVPRERWVVFYGCALLMSANMEQCVNDFKMIASQLAREPKLKMIDQPGLMCIGSERVSLEGFVVGGGVLAEIMPEQMLQEGGASYGRLSELHQNMRWAGKNVFHFHEAEEKIQQETGRGFSGGAIERLYPGL